MFFFCFSRKERRRTNSRMYYCYYFISFFLTFVNSYVYRGSPSATRGGRVSLVDNCSRFSVPFGVGRWISSKTRCRVVDVRVVRTWRSRCAPRRGEIRRREGVPKFFTFFYGIGYNWVGLFSTRNNTYGTRYCRYTINYSSVYNNNENRLRRH